MIFEDDIDFEPQKRWNNNNWMTITIYRIHHWQKKCVGFLVSVTVFTQKVQFHK